MAVGEEESGMKQDREEGWAASDSSGEQRTRFGGKEKAEMKQEANRAEAEIVRGGGGVGWRDESG